MGKIKTTAAEAAILAEEAFSPEAVLLRGRLADKTAECEALRLDLDEKNRLLCEASRSIENLLDTFDAVLCAEKAAGEASNANDKDATR